ncbi:MAG: gliding motility-associated C-terminal domain-containing protein, partial [Opitutaceae bacterium]|nr:gliding motility-associated C-terminal domain-containing protein [Cytophagales bacterium]
GPVCLGNPTEVTVELAEDGKFYEVFYNGKSISASTKGSGIDLKIPISTTIIPAGSNPLSIGISVPGCVPDTLTKKPVLEINSKASDSLLVSALLSPICIGTDGAVRITGIQPKVSYQAYIGSDSVSQTITGPGPDIILPVPATKLLPGMNSISVKAYIDGCTVSDLKDTAGIKVNPNPKVDLAISVDPSTICEGGESILTISTTEEGVSYQAVVGTKPYSSAVLSTGGEVKLTVFGLPQGVNIVGVEAFVQGCLKRNLDSTVSITVNKGPKLDYSVTGSTVCIGDSGKLTISGSEAGVLYQAFEKTSNGIFSRKVTGTGNAIVITLNPSTNPSDTIIVKAEITGCGIVRLENSGILITNDKNASKNLSTVGSTICINDVNATATIKNAIKDVSYEATFNSAKLPSQIGTGGDLIFNLPTSILSKGSYKVTFTATVQACGPVALDSVATVVINDNKSSKDLQVKGSDICVMDASGTATILSAIDGVTYQASINGKELPEKLIGEGADLVFTIPVVNINMGSNTVSFVATISGCTPVELTNKAIINRNDNTTSKDLSTRGSTVCANDPNATATIISAKSGISYQAFLGDKAVSDKLLANGSDLVLSIVTNQLASGQNVISFIATVAGCDPVKLDSNAIVVVIGDRYNIKGSSLRCYSTTGEYGITPVPGITVYKWTVPEGSKITSDSTGDRITVAFGEKSGKVTVTPVGNIGACDGVSSELYVSVEPSYKENLNILGKNLVCIKDGDIIQVDTVGVIGVDYIVWNMTQGIRINDTINKKSIFRKFNITYTRAGFETITARPHIRCSDTFGKEDTLRVEVLEYPVAEAGDYPLIENDLSSEVNLNGTGSTENVNAATSFINYKWYSTDRTIQINNPNTLNSASFVPTSSETKVYLKVSERNGLCPALDSAIINLTIGIQIPNIFTPNGDGVHDLWEIKNLNKLYPNCSVEVFNKWGSYIFKSNGYSEPWDGTRNGEDLPVATYYYVVDFKDGSKPRTGSVTIIR